MLILHFDCQHPGSPDSQWSKWFVQLSGTIMSTWNANEMEEAAREGRTVRLLSTLPYNLLFLVI